MRVRIDRHKTQKLYKEVSVSFARNSQVYEFHFNRFFTMFSFFFFWKKSLHHLYKHTVYDWVYIRGRKNKDKDIKRSQSGEGDDDDDDDDEDDGSQAKSVSLFIWQFGTIGATLFDVFLNWKLKRSWQKIRRRWRRWDEFIQNRSTGPRSNYLFIYSRNYGIATAKTNQELEWFC